MSVSTSEHCVTSQTIKNILYYVIEAWKHELQLLVSFSKSGICITTWKNRWVVSSSMRRGLNTQNSLLFWKIILEPVTGNVDISGVDALMYVVPSKAEKRALWGISWFHRLYSVKAPLHSEVKLCSLTVKKRLHEELNWMFSGTAQVSHQVCQFFCQFRVSSCVCDCGG